MALSSAIVAELVAAGLSGDALVAACARIEAASPAVVDEQAARRREADRIRKAEKRAVEKAERLRTSADSADVCGQPSRDIQNAPTHAEPEPNKTTFSPVQKDILTDIPKVPGAKPSCDDLGFIEVWEAYPRRQGGNSRKNAEVRYRKAVKSGVDAECILAGVRAYAAHCDATGKTGTEWVKTAEAWLNGRYWESDWSVSLSRAPPHRPAKNLRSLVDALHREIPDEPQFQPNHLRLAFGR